MDAELSEVAQNHFWTGGRKKRLSTCHKRWKKDIVEIKKKRWLKKRAEKMCEREECKREIG